jgi:hypothetical protein
MKIFFFFLYIFIQDMAEEVVQHTTNNFLNQEEIGGKNLSVF